MNHINSVSGSVTGSVRPVSIKPSSEETKITVADIVGSAQQQIKLSREQEKAIQQLDKAIQAIQGPDKSYEISVHEQTNAIMIKVKNKDTGEIIREIPQEKLLDVAASMMELNGLIIDERG